MQKNYKALVLLGLSVGNKHGYINYSGQPVIDTTGKYTKTYSFNEGLAKVEMPNQSAKTQKTKVKRKNNQHAYLTIHWFPVVY